jgi:hypothetical protein
MTRSRRALVDGHSAVGVLIVVELIVAVRTTFMNAVSA